MGTVYGRILFMDKSNAAGVTVRAFDQDLPSKADLARQPLGDPGRTDNAGRYKIEYSDQQYLEGEASSERGDESEFGAPVSRRFGPDIVIVASLDESGSPVESKIHFNAAPELEIEDLWLNQRPRVSTSEFEQLSRILEPVVGAVPIERLTDADIAFLEGETGWSSTYIRFFVRAAQFQRETELASEAFYALMRAGLTAELRVLLDQQASVHRQALESALKSEPPIIATRLTERIPDWIRRLQELRLRYISEHTGEGQPPSLGMWLSLTVEVEAVRDRFLRVLVDHDGDVPAFWEEVKQDEVLRAEVGRIQTGLQIGVLTQHDPRLARAVLASHRPQALRDLVKLTPADWENLLETSRASIPPDTPGSTPEVQRRVYAATLVGMLQLALPVETSAHAIAQVEEKHFRGANIRDGVARFLLNACADDLKTKDANFDLATSHIGQFAAFYPDKVFAGVSEDDQSTVLEEVKRVQRLYRISTRPETLAALLEMPHGSAYEIARLPKKGFVAQHAEQLGGDNEAGLIHDRAVTESATRLQLAVQMYQHLNEPVPAFIGGQND